jgi:hypothetical protein
MGSRHDSAWHLSVDERYALIAKALATNHELREKLPGLKSLLDDYLDRNVDITTEDFYRRVLQTFRDSTADYTYQDQLASFLPEERTKISRFVDGKSLTDVCHGFCADMGPSLGVREHLNVMAESDIVHVSSTGPVYVKGLSMGNAEEDGVFLKFVHDLARLLHLSEHHEKDTVTVKSLLRSGRLLHN